MFELSHRLIGIYKTANVTQSMSPLPFLPSPGAQFILGIAIDNHALVPTKVVMPVTTSTA